MARIGKKKKGRKSKASASNILPSTTASDPVTAKVWRPGVDNIENDEELTYDPTAYDCYHAFRLEWPCLSFDILRDSFGALRSEFPHTVFCVAGTQADTAANNVLAVLKLSNITGKKRKSPSVNKDGGSEDSESSSDEDEDMEVPQLSNISPSLQERMVAHQGCVNRVRAMPQQPHIVASWADSGYVQIWDFGAHIRSLSTGIPDPGTPSGKVIRQAPLQIFTGHKSEGFALDWSPTCVGRLLSGDCNNAIYLWDPTPGGRWAVGSTPFLGHASSVEDLQWSPTETNVFASCSADGTFAIWDTRSHSQAISVKAHDTDVNVISWNRLASCMLASGSDDGVFRIWDLRYTADSFVSHHKYHTGPITSIEWSPHESSVLATTSADNRLLIWDQSLERDAEEEAEFQAQLKINQAQAPEDLSPNLLFEHMGQHDLKEFHWHPQIHGLIISTAGDGFNVFRPSNLEPIEKTQ